MSPEGAAQVILCEALGAAPSGLILFSPSIPGLTPGAILSRPFGPDFSLHGSFATDNSQGLHPLCPAKKARGYGSRKPEPFDEDPRIPIVQTAQFELRNQGGSAFLWEQNPRSAADNDRNDSWRRN